jgi:ABC-2 type transport system ATP-binding protein
VDEIDRQEVRRPVLELDALAKRYGRVHALEALTLSVREGEVYGFLGRNGAGKSTAIRIIMGITRASGGQVRMFGENATRGRHIALRQRIGYVAQEQSFYHWMTPKSLGRFVRGFYPTWDDHAFTTLITRLDLPPARRIAGFSGGMKVKLALACALAHRPRLLVLDEPTAGLDPVARREFLETISEEARQSGATTFFSTHLIDEVEIAAHRVGIVDGGRTLYEGPVDALQARYRLLTPESPHAAASPPPALSDPREFRVAKHRLKEGVPLVLVEAASPERFGLLEGAGWRVEMLPLEELFIELVRSAR